jgi:hypothetical protein
VFTVAPALPPAREARGAVRETVLPQPDAAHPVPGWCVECGQFVLAAAPDTSLCAFHLRSSPASTRVAAPTRSDSSGPGRGRDSRRARRALARVAGRARGRAYGRERARRRLASGRWDPHPGWRNRVDRDLEVLTDQASALRRVEQLVDTELWRADKRICWTRMLRRLVCAMNWTTGLVCGVTLAQLAEVGGCSQRTVSRLLAWAQDVDLVVVVEVGAAATFLGTATNRAPAYVLVAPPTPPVQESVGPDDEPADQAAVTDSAQVSGPVDESGDLPHSYAGNKPLTGGRRLERPAEPQLNWPAWQIPANPAERSAAVTTFLARIGLEGTVPAWRVRALLHQWWIAGACVAGLLHAIDHLPDGTLRGNALRGAADPLRVLGYRLRPWVGQLNQLPSRLAGRHGDYRAAQATTIAERIAAAERDRARTDQAGRSQSTAAAREAARAALEAVLADRARRREATGRPRRTGHSIRPSHTPPRTHRLSEH